MKVIRIVTTARLRRFVIGAIVALVAAASVRIVAQQTPPGRPFEPTALQQSACLAFDGVTSARHATTGAMRFIGTDAGSPLPHPLGHDARTPPETAARGFLSVCGSLFGLTGDPSELAVERTEITDDQRSVI